MAKVTITISDAEGDLIVFDAEADPPIKMDDGEERTKAQECALSVVDFIVNHARGIKDFQVNHEQVPFQRSEMN